MVYIEHISDLVLVFEHVIAGWANLKSNVKNQIYASIKFRKLIPNKNVK